jgi:hypothetical protein
VIRPLKRAQRSAIITGTAKGIGRSIGLNAASEDDLQCLEWSMPTDIFGEPRPNAMKLTSEFLLYQLLTQFLPGFDHQRDALGPPLLDARLHPMRACRAHDQRYEWHASIWR